MSLRIILFVFLLSFGTSEAWAKAPAGQKSLGTFSSWHTFSFMEGNEPVCYMALDYAPPKNPKLKRSGGRLTITERPGDTSLDVVSYGSGYIFKTGSSVTITAGKSSFDLFTVKDEAWTRDTATDRKLTAAIKSNASLVITGAPSQHGMAAVKDKLDLTGASKAYAAIAKACNIETEQSTPAPAAKMKKPATSKK